MMRQAGASEVFVLEDNGTSFSSQWPIMGTGYTSFGPVVLADINGDSLPEIVTSEYAVNTAPNPLLPRNDLVTPGRFVDGP